MRRTATSSEGRSGLAVMRAMALRRGGRNASWSRWRARFAAGACARAAAVAWRSCARCFAPRATTSGASMPRT